MLIRPVADSLIEFPVHCVVCMKEYIPATQYIEHLKFGIPFILLNNYCCRKCFDQTEGVH